MYSSFFKVTKTILRSSYFIATSGHAFNKFFGMLISVILARFLGPEEFGTFSLFFTVFILVNQTQGGTNITYVALTKTCEESEKPSLFKTISGIQLLISSLILLTGFPLSLLLSKVLYLSDPRLIFFGFISGGFLSFFQLWLGFFQEKEMFFKHSLIVISFNFLLLSFVAFSFYTASSLSVLQIIYFYLLVSFILGLLGGYFIFSTNRKNLFKKKAFFDMLFMTLKNISITLCYFLFRSLDIFFIKRYLDLEAVGIYSVALRLSGLLSVPLSGMSTILLPKASASLVSPKKVKDYLFNSSLLSIFVVSIFIIIYFFSPFLVNFLFGHEYFLAQQIFRILIIGWIFNVFYLQAMQLVYALNRSGFRLFLELQKIFICTVFFFLFIPRFGINGAAWSIFISMAFTCIIGIFSLQYLLRKHFSCANL